ncbi:MAG: hypothetical protein O3A46_02980 [Candidatus Poribacteria bacterium]|nr:hypothetical protein [Candidatus Poribacteria bacterium]
MSVIFEDSLNGKLGDGWEWLRESPDTWRFGDEGLEICVQPGVADTVKNALVRTAPDRNDGAFAIEITVMNHTRPTQQYEQAGITWYNDGKPVFKIVKELIDGDLFIIPGRPSMRAKSVRLRLVVTANSWEALYRPEGESEYQTAAKGELPAPKNDQVSIQCYNGPADEQHWIRFTDFSISKEK